MERGTVYWVMRSLHFGWTCEEEVSDVSILGRALCGERTQSAGTIDIRKKEHRLKQKG